MVIEFERLKNINTQDIVALNTNERVLQQMPLAGKNIFDEDYCISWVNQKEELWSQYGYGPWAFIIDGKFAGWGGLQYEQGDADLALVLHPDYWGYGKYIFNKIIAIAFNEWGLKSITILLPLSRNKLKAIYKLGFKIDGSIMIGSENFIRYRLFSAAIND